MPLFPITLTLPSRRRVTLREEAAGRDHPRGEAQDRLFDDVIALLETKRVHIVEKGDPIDDPLDLDLADFHVIRALALKAGLVEEEDVELDCHNCGEEIVVRPCAGIEVGPWKDGELDDPELDRYLAVGRDTPIDLATPIPLGRVRLGHTVTLERRTLKQAMPLLRALAKDPFHLDEGVVTAMGIVAIGPISQPRRLAQALSECSDAAFGAVTDVFLATYYSLRLASDVFCKECKARNTIDAPALREFELQPPSLTAESAERAQAGEGADGRVVKNAPLPKLDDFVDLAHAIADPLIAKLPPVGAKVELIVESGTPAVDDGGEPLLGSYTPPPPTDAHGVLMTPPTVTIYYQTFAAIEREEGLFDWEDELRETIEHELEHHVYFLTGDDPMDEEEHAEIDREVARVVGVRESTRRTLAVFGMSIPDFFVRAWPLVVIAALVLCVTVAESRCSSR